MSYDFLFLQAQKLHESGHFAEAEQLYRQILETAPNHPDVLNLLGLVAQVKGLHNEAINLFHQALTQAPNHAPFYFNLALSLDCAGKSAEAIKIYQKALGISPNLKEAWYNLGNIYKLHQDNATAIHHYQKALDIDGDYLEPQVELALLSPDSLEKLLELRPKYAHSPLPLYHLSQYYLHHNNVPQALNYALESQQLAPNEEETNLITAQAYLMLKQQDKAKIYFSQALKINPRSLTSLINLGNLNSLKKDYATAEQFYQNALDFAPNEAAIHINYADMLYRSGRTQEAVEAYHRAIILSPDSPEISNNLGIIQKDLGELESAIGLFFNALILNPQIPEFSLNLQETLILLHRQEPEKAIKIAQNWQKANPENNFAHHILSAFLGQDSLFAPQYSTQLFNAFADNYETVLQKINYCIPQKLQEILPAIQGLAIDLGCGTGLVAEALKTPNNHFIGVDISENMLKIAQTKGLYQDLILGDILEYAKNNLPTLTPEIIIAADVFGYLGNLENILRLCSPYKLAFSIEISSQAGYHLTPSGRYQHHPDYINKLLSKLGYSKLDEYPLILRQENGQDVKGLIVLAQH